MPLVLDGTNGVSGVDGTASNPSYEGTDSNTGIFYPAADTVAIGTGGTERLRVDSAGNSGFGVTPPTSTDAGNITIKNGSTLNWSAGSANITSNATFNSSWKYITTAPATRYRTDSGQHIWDNAASGTAGNAITFTQAMTLDASGNLSVAGGSTNTTYSSPGQIAIKRSTNAPYMSWHADDGTRLGYLQIQSGGVAALSVEVNQALFFATNATERARFASGGSFLIGNHTNEYKLVTINGSVYPYNNGSYYCANGAPGTSDQFSDRSNNNGDGFYHRFIHTASGGWWAYRSDYDSASTNTNFNPFQYWKTSVLKFNVSVTGQITAQGSYDATTASAANLFVTSGGVFQRSTSSIKYKTQVESIEHGKADAILNLRPVWYRSTCEADNPDWSWYGLIAEEVAEIEPRLVHWGYNDQDYEFVETEGKRERKLKSDAQLAPEGVQYDRMTVLLLDIVKRQQSRLEALEAEIQALKGNA